MTYYQITCCLLQKSCCSEVVNIENWISFSVSYRSDSLGIRRVTSTPSKTSSLERNRKFLKGRVLVMLTSLIVQKT